MSTRSLLGIVIVLFGLFLFSTQRNMMDPGHIIGIFWPSMFVLPLGLLFHWMYFYALERKGSGLLIPGGILVVTALVCQISMLFDVWQYMWPGFPLAVAFGLFEFYWFSGRNKWLLVPVFINASVSIIFFTVFTLGSLLSFSFMGQSTAAIVLIVIGLLVVFRGKRQV
ncbi:hypothetical protein [Paenibacillus humicola]|uniref:hypothetical protein n=1 Tax=Paenibacillus humicola TaxID=3110540 RepID=UPI00237C0311|nr:hypothetical protein [Paenibacillus humicola]